MRPTGDDHASPYRHYDAVSPNVFDADPSLGLHTEPRAGLEDQHREPLRYVRAAQPGDTEAIGRVHAAVMRASLEAAHGHEHDGAGLPAGVLAMMSAPVLAAGWEQAVTAPPSARHQVLVAVEDEEVVGLIAVAPTAGQAVAVDSSGQPTGAVADEASSELGMEVIAAGVEPQAQRRGHGSRLLAAASEHAAAQGATTLLMWALRGDESLAGLLRQAGLAPTGSTRYLPVGQGVVEECWAAAL